MTRRFDVARTFRALRHRNFRLFFVGQGLSLVGTWLQQVAMGWLTYRVSGSALLLGVIAFTSNIGFLVLSPFTGVLADRIDRRRALLVTQTLLAVQAYALAFVVAFGDVAPWHLVAFAAWLGLVSAFDVPLRQSLYARLVDERDDLPNAIALNSFLVNAGRVLGPAVAGALLALVGEAVCFALNALSFLAVIVALARMRWRTAGPAVQSGSWWRDWSDGARHVATSAPVRTLLVLVAALAWTITPYSSLMPIYAKDIYHGGPAALGVLLAAAGAGALLAAIHLAWRSTIKGLAREIAVAAMVGGIALAAFAYQQVLLLGIALMTLVGGGVILAAAATNTILQSIAEDRLRGRIAGFFTMAFLGVAPLGNLVAGALAATIGVQATFALNGVLALLAGLWFLHRLPAIAPDLRATYRRMGLDRDRPPSPDRS